METKAPTKELSKDTRENMIIVIKSHKLYPKHFDL